MNSLFKISISLLALFTVSACQYRSDKVNHEDEALAPVVLTQSQSEAMRKADDSDFSNININSTHDQFANANTVEEFEKALNNIEPYAMNKRFIEDPKYSNTNKLKTLLGYYNYGVLKLSQLKADDAVINKRLSLFEANIYSGCGENLKSCINVGFFSSDYRSSQVILLLVRNLDQKIGSLENNDNLHLIKKYYDLLALAFDVNNHTRNNDMEFYYIKRASQYGRYFNNLPVEVRTQNADFFKRHGLVFENIVSKFPADDKNPQFAAFVKAFNPWNYSRMNKDPFPFGVQKMFSFAATHYLYETNKEGKHVLNEDLKAAIAASQSREGGSDVSFTQSIAALLQDSASTQMFFNLGLSSELAKQDSFRNEYFFMIDRLYRGDLGLEEVNSIWQGSDKNEKALLEVVNYYIKIEFIKKIADTNKYMSDVFSQNDIPADSLFKQVIQRSESLTKKWGTMLLKMDNISIFVTKQLRDTKSDSKNLKDVQLMIDSVKRNAKFLAVYPNMLLMGYYMIDLKAPLRIKTWWGAEFAIDPNNVMNLLLDGAFEQPWFLFGGDSAPLNKTEIIFAYYYALNAGTFEAFGAKLDDKKQPTVDKVSFFKKALKNSMKDQLDAINASSDALINKSEGDPSYISFMNICANENKKNQNYTVSMKLTDLKGYALFGNKANGTLSYASGFYSGYSIFDAVSKIHSDLEPRLIQIKSMMELLKLNLSKKGIDEKTKKELADIQYEIDKIEIQKKNYIKNLVEKHNQISGCMNKLIGLERKRESELFMAESKYLEKVYDALIKLQNIAPNLKSAALAQIKKDLKFGEGENLTENAYYYSKLDLLNRFARFSNDPSLSPRIEFEQADDTTKNALRQELQKVYFKNPVTNQVVTKESFVSSDLKFMNSMGSDANLWLQENATLDLYDSKIKTMINLYILGFDSGTASDPKTSISAKDIINEIVEMQKTINITNDEKIWLAKMGRNERIWMKDLKGYIFDGSDDKFLAIMDSYYEYATNIRSYLKEGVNYRMAVKNRGSFLFPPSCQDDKAVDVIYREYVKRAEDIVIDFNKAVLDKEAEISKFESTNRLNSGDSLKVTYRIGVNGDYSYHPSLVSTGPTLLIDKKRIQDMDATLLEFHNRDTSGYFLPNRKLSDEEKKCQ